LARHPNLALLTRYATVGGASALAELLLFYAFVELLGIDVMIANVTAVSIVTVMGFIGQKRFTFRDHGRMTPQAALYLVQVGVNFLLNNGLVYLFTRLMRMPPMFAKPLQLGLCFAFNFSFSRFVVFRTRTRKAA
jgi:putative flippase GtrA